jgi:hypothetical protein
VLAQAIVRARSHRVEVTPRLNLLKSSSPNVDSKLSKGSNRITNLNLFKSMPPLLNLLLQQVKLKTSALEAIIKTRMLLARGDLYLSLVRNKYNVTSKSQKLILDQNSQETGEGRRSLWGKCILLLMSWWKRMKYLKQRVITMNLMFRRLMKTLMSYSPDQRE